MGGGTKAGVAAVLVLALGMAGYGAWSWLGGPGTPPGILRATGRLDADTVPVLSRAGGRVNELVPAGADVAAGTVLARLGPATAAPDQLAAADAAVRQADAARAPAEAEVTRRRAERDAARTALERTMDQIRARRAAPETADSRRVALDGAEDALAAALAAQRRAAAGVQAAQAALAELRNAANGTTVVAPRAGRVVERPVAVGGTVSPGGTVAVLADPASFRMTVTLPSDPALRPRDGAAARLASDAAPAQVLPATLAAGGVLRLAPDALRQAGTLRPGPATAWIRVQPDAPWPEQVARAAP